MGKPFEQTGGGGGATGHVEPPSLLSSFAGIIETGMLNVFQSVADKGDDSVSRVNSLRRAPGDNIVRGGGGERGSAATEGNDAISKRLSGRLSRLASESESDMPGLERLERSTCPASSEDEVRSKVILTACLLAARCTTVCCTVSLCMGMFEQIGWWSVSGTAIYHTPKDLPQPRGPTPKATSDFPTLSQPLPRYQIAPSVGPSRTQAHCFQGEPGQAEMILTNYSKGS